VTTTRQDCGIRNQTAIGSMRELKDQVGPLMGRLEFGEARRRLESTEKNQLAASDEDRQWIAQQLALCTYKDEELPPSIRFAKALAFARRYWAARSKPP
jgi:hypothetical protein